jgi:hypothetical protein
MSEHSRDPRDVITPDAFSVAPELLDTPLARPWRRGVAMGVDLILIAIIGAISGWFFLGLASAFLFFQLARRPAGGWVKKGSRWLVFGTVAALILIVTLAYGWDKWVTESLLEIDPAEEVLSGLGAAGGTVADVITMTTADSEDELRDAAIAFGEGVREQGVDDSEIVEALEGIASSREEPWAKDAIEAALSVLGAGAADAGLDADSLAIAYSAALQAGDSASVAALRGPLTEAIAANRIALLEEQAEDLRDENERMEERLDGESSRGLIGLILKVADEVGIELGWSAFYFTFFPVFWRGRTPGKRLMRARIVRLDGKPLGWWAALNRFGGYAASIFTGLLGFFEMFWDDNRQALQDRIASTVVVRD